MLADRVEALAEAHYKAKLQAVGQRERNMKRLSSRTAAPQYEVGQQVMLENVDKTTFQPKYTHGYLVTRVQGPVVTIVGPKLRIQKVNAERLKPAPIGFDYHRP